MDDKSLNAMSNLCLWCYSKWEYVKEHGANDKDHSDGEILNQIRSQIQQYRKKLEAAYPPKLRPTECERPLPLYMDNSYMAQAQQIRERADWVLSFYSKDKNFLYIQSQLERTEQVASIQDVVTLLHTMVKLQIAINSDDLFAMKLSEDPTPFIEKAAVCAEKVRAWIQQQDETISQEENPDIGIGYMEMG